MRSPESQQFSYMPLPDHAMTVQFAVKLSQRYRLYELKLLDVKSFTGQGPPPREPNPAVMESPADARAPDMGTPAHA